jgi:hypothetical protein
MLENVVVIVTTLRLWKSKTCDTIPQIYFDRDFINIHRNPVLPMQPLQTKSTFLMSAAIMSLLLLTTSHNVFAQQQQPPQQQKKGLVVVSDNGFKDNDPNLPQYHIVGEVQNNGSEQAKFHHVLQDIHQFIVMDMFKDMIILDQ